MSFVIAAPEMVTDAATNLASIGSAIGAANAAAAAPTTEIISAGADEVSTAITTIFSEYASEYQALTAKAAAFHAQFMQTLNAGASMYTVTEAASANPLQILQQAVLAVDQRADQPVARSPADRRRRQRRHQRAGGRDARRRRRPVVGQRRQRREQHRRRSTRWRRRIRRPDRQRRERRDGWPGRAWRRGRPWRPVVRHRRGDRRPGHSHDPTAVSKRRPDRKHLGGQRSECAGDR